MQVCCMSGYATARMNANTINLTPNEIMAPNTFSAMKEVGRHTPKGISISPRVVIMPNSTFTRKTCIAIIIKQIMMNRYSAKQVIKCDNSVTSILN